MLNGTFLVQAINFFIAYLILDRLLLRPAVREIAADHQEKKLLEQAVNYEKDAVKHLDLERSTAWQAACAIFAQQMPPLRQFDIGIAHQEELPPITPLSSAEINRVIDESAQRVIKEVDHVH